MANDVEYPIVILNLILTSACSSDGWPMCNFQEYIYGPKSHWPEDEELLEIKAGRKELP